MSVIKIIINDVIKSKYSHIDGLNIYVNVDQRNILLHVSNNEYICTRHMSVAHDYKTLVTLRYLANTQWKWTPYIEMDPLCM